MVGAGEYSEMTDDPGPSVPQVPPKGRKGKSASDAPPDVPPARAALVKKWLDTIQSDIKFFKPDFEQMDKNMQLAREGASKEWIAGDNYVAAILPRVVNQAVSQLFAKNPKAVATRRKRLLFQIWDENPQTLQDAMMKVAPPPDLIPAPNPALPPVTPDGQPWEPDPQAVALIQEVKDAQDYNRMVEKLGKGVEILWDYYTGEQASSFKLQMKAGVRRTKVCGISWVKLGFQRQMKMNPEVAAKIEDATTKLTHIQSLQEEIAEGEIDQSDAQAEELKLLIQQLQNSRYIVFREGPVFDFPKSKDIIPDQNVVHLKTLSGCEHITHRMRMTPDRVKEIYGVDISGNFTEYKPELKPNEKADTGRKVQKMACLYEVQNKRNCEVFVVCEGYPDFIKEPAEPDVELERFYNLFPLVFNECEDDERVIPPADVYLARDPAAEYNRARQGLREHRKANRPKYATVKGSLDKNDIAALKSDVAHMVLQLKALKPGQDVNSLIQRLQMVGIDPNMYEVNQLFQDVQRAIGVQEANIGGISGASATETSIAENSHGSSRDENIDDLDEMLGELAHSFAQMCLMELSKETVVEICGPGAVWPEMQEKRDEIVKDLLLTIKGGSSGRPNAAAELANIERALPYALQIPGKQHYAVALMDRMLTLLDIDPDELDLEAAPPISPSVVAQNALDGRGGPPAGPMAPGGDPAKQPGAQGGEGATNAPSAQRNEPGAQPAHPAPQPSNSGPLNQA